jgi:signal transduction histidine kinase
MPNTTIQDILYVEDDAALARLLQRRLERYNLNVEIVASAEAALEKLKTKTYDILLVDYILPAMNGLELLDKLPEIPNAPPAIILTAGGDERVAVAALEKGAVDYAVKDSDQTYLELLPSIMQAAHTKQRLQREFELQHHELQFAKEKAELANQAKSNFLATMSHEMRTPLNVIIGLAHLLNKKERPPKEQEMMQTLLTNADLLLRLINDLLDITRIESGQVELEITSFDMASVLKDIETMFAPQAKEKSVRFAIHDTTDNMLVMGDRTRVQQILMNLAANALKFTAQGEINIRTGCIEKTPNEICFSIEVQDTGIGISPEKLGGIFDKFTQADETITRRFGGSGLGLTIVRALAQKMGGDVSVVSQLGQGSCFTVSLNLPKAEIKQAPQTIAPHAYRPKTSGQQPTKKVLVVEDYAPNIMVVSLILENFGYDVIATENGAKALEYLRTQSQPPVAILMDVQMRGMDGYQTTGHIRDMEKTKGYKNFIIGVTAHALAGDRDRCIAAGMDDYMSKPIHPDILAAKLQKLMQQPLASAA